MERTKKMMIVGFLVLVMAAFALPPAFAVFEKDIITPKGVRMAFGEAALHLDEEAIYALTGKVLISNPIIEAALIQHSDPLAGVPCGESCNVIPCIASLSCRCKSKVCFQNSLDN
uniref:Cyclotide n=1 Tax=Viola tricolor TaxID=214053 RepID=A0A0N9YKR6_9ROSI|nr:cyclotide precursor [Viola tricolor]